MEEKKYTIKEITESLNNCKTDTVDEYIFIGVNKDEKNVYQDIVMSTATLAGCLVHIIEENYQFMISLALAKQVVETIRAAKNKDENKSE